MAGSTAKRPDGRWRARYRDAAGKEHAKHFRRKVDAQDWLDGETAKMRTGTWTDPRTARLTVTQWCDTWLAGYSARPASVYLAQEHIKRIKAEFGSYPLASVRPSQVRAWTAKLAAENLAPGYVHILYRRLAQIMAAAVNDSVIPRSPCSRQVSPKAGQQRPDLISTAQVWALHKAMPAELRVTVLLGAFAGLRVSEVCGLRVTDVDFMRGIITPAVQYPDRPLKSETSVTPVPIPRSMTLELSAHVAAHPGERLAGVSPWQLERTFKTARGKVPGLPDGFRYHDLRHYYASLLIASGCDVKTVQARMRHASATTTLNVYGHLWPDKDESTRAAVEAVFADRADQVRTVPGQ